MTLWRGKLPGAGADRAVLRAATLSIAVRVAGVAFSYAANILLSRTLGVRAFGEYVIALSWALALVLPAKAGFDISALRYSSLYFERRDFGALRGFIIFAFAIVALLSFSIAAIVWAAGPIPVSSATRAWATFLIPPLALLAFFSVVMRTTGRIMSSQVYEQILRPAIVIAGLGLVAFWNFRLSSASAMALTAIAAALALLALLVQLARIFRPTAEQPARYEEWRQWLIVSLPMLLLGVVQELMNQIDVILLGQFADARQAALFAASSRVASLVPFALVGLATVTGPMIASAYDKNDIGELHRISSLVARGGFAFAIICAAMLLAMGSQLLALFGRDFVAGKDVLLVLLLGGVANAFTGIVAYFTILTGRERQTLAIFAFSLCLSVVLNVLLIPGFGALGAAIASSSATIAWNLILLFYVRRSLGLDASAIALSPRAKG